MKYAESIIRRLRNVWWRVKFRAWVRFAERHVLFVNVTPGYCREFRDYGIWGELRRFRSDHKL